MLIVKRKYSRKRVDMYKQGDRLIPSLELIEHLKSRKDWSRTQISFFAESPYIVLHEHSKIGWTIYDNGAFGAWGVPDAIIQAMLPFVDSD